MKCSIIIACVFAAVCIFDTTDSHNCQIPRGILFGIRREARRTGQDVRDMATAMALNQKTLAAISEDTQAMRPAIGPINCTLEILSGVVNPTFQILPSDVLYPPIALLALATPDAAVESVLGYRGFQCDIELPDGTISKRTFASGSKPALELLLLEAGNSAISTRADELAKAAIHGLDTPVSADVPDTTATVSTVACADPCVEPTYNPTLWNDAGAVQADNNCYNYATVMQTGTYAQPGRASGTIYTALTGTAVALAAKNDGLWEFASPPAAGAFPVTDDCLVALVIDNDNDFHWLRQDAGGNWSHKIGDAEATNLDNGGAVITDPRTANIAPYIFVKFMGVCPPPLTVSK